MFDFAKAKGEYKNRLSTAWDLYKDVDGYKGVDGFKKIKREVVADLAGDYLFTDPDFISNLSANHRNVFQYLYDEIKYLCKIATAGSKEARQLERVKKTFEDAYRADSKVKPDGKTTFALEYADDTPYVRTERNSYVKEDGTPMTEKEVFDSLVGKTIHLSDGEVKIVKNLPGKKMYKELYNRQPKRWNGVENVKQLNSDVNYNMEELLANSEMLSPNEPDVGNRHKEQGITNFDTRKVNFYDGSKAYNIELSIGILNTGEKVAYAKRFFGYDAELTKKIQATETRGLKSTPMNQQPAFDTKIPQNGTGVKRGTGNSAQSSENLHKDVVENRTSSLSVDSDGNKLTEAQAEWGKNSKMRDDNGNLKVMYHGSQNAGFHVFDAQMLIELKQPEREPRTEQRFTLTTL